MGVAMDKAEGERRGERAHLNELAILATDNYKRQTLNHSNPYMDASSPPEMFWIQNI